MFIKLFALTLVLKLVSSQDEFDGRIVGGVAAAIEDIPYQAGIRIAGSFCGGSIIASNAILTAAHCTAFSETQRKEALVTVSDDIYDFRVLLYRISQIYDHPNFDKKTYDNDISVLILSDNLRMGSKIAIIPIASHIPQNGDTVTVSGWGLTDPDNEKSTSTQQLQVLNIPFIDTNTCRRTALYNNKITNNMVCAGYTDRVGLDACKGDSGGPLVHYGELVGVVSFGTGCASLGYPGVYTKVYNYRNFINDILEANKADNK